MLWGLCFAAGAYEIYRIWAAHQGAHGDDPVRPLGLPDLPPDTPTGARPHMRLGA